MNPFHVEMSLAIMGWADLKEGVNGIRKFPPCAYLHNPDHYKIFQQIDWLC